jgi:predicted transcriptional regulator of viral defense system
VEHHAIGGVNVPVYGLSKTLADVFRHPRLVARATAVEALRRAVRERKVTLEALERNARAGSVWTIMRPYLDSALLRA